MMVSILLLPWFRRTKPQFHVLADKASTLSWWRIVEMDTSSAATLPTVTPHMEGPLPTALHENSEGYPEAA
jgi:hypothetical protein